MEAKQGSTFLMNVDLELESEHGFSALAAALEPVAISMERPPGRASFELNSATNAEDSGALIREFVALIAQLPEPARQDWDRASKRVFDIGLQSRHSPFSEGHRLSAETLQAVLGIGAEIAITIYAVDPDEQSPAPS